MIFTIPALVIMGYWPDFKYWWVLGIAGLGGLLGVLFSVPLRRSMIVEDPLPFPEGKAAAEVLKAGENPGPGLKILGLSAVIGAFVKLAAESGMRLIPDAWATSAYVGSSRSPPSSAPTCRRHCSAWATSSASTSASWWCPARS